MYIAPHLWKISRTRGPKLFCGLRKKNQKLGLEKFLSPQNFRSSRSNFFWEGEAQCTLRPTFGNFSRARGPEKKKLDLEFFFVNFYRMKKNRNRTEQVFLQQHLQWEATLWTQGGSLSIFPPCL